MSESAVAPQWIVPEWPVPPRVRALITTRAGGVSAGAFGAGDAGGGMNVGTNCGDATEAVQANRARLRALLPAEPHWLQQEHGATVVAVDEAGARDPADAAIATRPGQVCVVSVADCLPVLLAERDGRAVGAAHAGWRGLAAGVIQNTAAAMRARLGSGDGELVAYLGPAIGPRHFEVGAEVLEAMRALLPSAAEAFVPQRSGKLLCDLFALARQALRQAGVDAIHGGGLCTYSDPGRFYSYRRDRITGRHAALIWLDG